MKNMICIVCPGGCHLEVDEEQSPVVVTGNRCKKGETFAIDELTHPMRTLCTSVRCENLSRPVLSVRTSCEIPKESIMDVMKEINRATISSPVKTGDIIIKNVLGLSADIIATSDIEAAS